VAGALVGWVGKAAVCGCVGVVFLGEVVLAQDTRTVTEPKIPPVCVRLEAKLYAAPDENGGRIRDEDEGKLDTERIQKAIDGCGAGKAVELAIGSNCRGGAGACGLERAFLSGPLELREGVTLLVDKGVTLYGSRDPQVYEIANPDAKPGDPMAPIKCGTSMARPATFPAPLAQTAAARRGGCRSRI
jgi:polygalacturonase